MDDDYEGNEAASAGGSSGTSRIADLSLFFTAFDPADALLASQAPPPPVRHALLAPH